MANLTGQNIKDTYQQLVTLGSGTTITNGTGSQITDLAVTASWAQNAVTASYALNAGTTVNTGSLMVTGSVSGNVLTFTKGDGSAFNLTVNTGSAVAVDTGSLMVTASAAGNVITFTKGDASTFTVTVATGSAVSSSYASFAENAGQLGGQLPAYYATATSVTNLSSSVASRLTSDEASIAANTAAISSLTAATSSYALKTEVSGAFASTSASFAARLTTDEAILSAVVAATASYATTTQLNNVSSSIASRLTTDESAIADLTAATASYAKTNVNNNFSGTQTFDNIAVNGTGSFAYIQSVTGSAKIIGDAYIILNNDTPTERYAGIKVIDSGSANVTASLLFDGLYNNWFYEYTSGSTDHAVALFGPAYGDIGTPSYPTANYLQKGTGGHHLADSSISDDGTTVSIGKPVDVTGAVSASAGFKGNLDGTATTATTASKVTTSPANDGTAYDLVFVASQAAGTQEVRTDDNGNITFNPSTGTLSVPTLSGNATTATTASYATYAATAGTAISASYAATASYVDLGTSATGSFTAATTWTFTHNLNKQPVVVQTYDTNWEEIIPGKIDLTDANTATITFPVAVAGYAVASLGNGVTQGSGGGGATSVADLLSNTYFSTPVQTLDPTPQVITNFSISSSGLHYISSSNTTTSSSINIYWHPDNLANGELAAVKLSLPAGSASTGIFYRTLVTASNSTLYWYPSTTAASSNVSFMRVAARAQVLIPTTGPNLAYMYKDTTGKVWMANGSSGVAGLPLNGQTYEWSGSIGTPIA